MNLKSKIIGKIEITKLEYEHLNKLRNYVNTWCSNYQECKKCGTYNPIGYKCSNCGKDNS